MIDLHRFLTNPFDNPGISLDELLAFSTDHLERLKANNLGEDISARITATTTALAAVNATITEDQTKLGQRKGKKRTKADFRKGLSASVTKIYGAVIAKFGAKGAETLECFPQGRSVFKSASDDQLGNHLQTLVTGVTTHAGALGATVVTDASALLTGWTAVYVPSESSSGAKTTTQAAKNVARADLQLELFKNLLTLALNFPRQPEQLDGYMRQSLLEDRPVAPVAPAPSVTPPPPGP